MRLYIFRVDGSSTLGLGHVMRCLNLADRLRSHGIECRFICRETVGHAEAIIDERGFSVTLLTTPDNSALTQENWKNDAVATLATLSGNTMPDWIIVDHYTLDKRWETFIATETGANIWVIDDLADRPHMADMLLDQNVHSAGQAAYNKLLNDNCRIFIGPEYALLASRFFSITPTGTPDAACPSVFIFFSAADPYGDTLRVLKQLEHTRDAFGIVSVVCGSRNPVLNDIHTLCRTAGYHLHIDTNDMPALMANADIAIGSGGVNTWERCFFHIPTLVFSIAGNQEAIAEECQKRGYIDYVGRIHRLSDADITAALCRFLENENARMNMAAALKRDFGSSGLNEALAFAMSNPLTA